MEEIEVPTEHLHEQIKEKTEELIEKGEGKSFLYIAISTALMAVFAAIAGLLAGHHSNEALIDQIKASDQWAYYQAKSIKAEIRLLQVTAGKEVRKSPEEEKKEAAEIYKKAKEFEDDSKGHLGKHVWLARAVTLSQVAIAISAISILTKKKMLWMVGVVISLVGLIFFAAGVL